MRIARVATYVEPSTISSAFSSTEMPVFFKEAPERLTTKLLMFEVITTEMVLHHVPHVWAIEDIVKKCANVRFYLHSDPCITLPFPYGVHSK